MNIKMNDYNPSDICHHCNDRMYEYLKQKIIEKIDEWYDDPDEPDVERVLKSLLETEK